MGKKIKLTEAQVAMLNEWESKNKKKVLRVTVEQYERLFGPLEENQKLTGHPIAGDGGNEYNPQTEKENEKTTQAFNESISEDINTAISLQEFIPHLQTFFQNLVANPAQQSVDSFWTNHGIGWGDLVKELIAMNLATPIMVGRVKTVSLIKSAFTDAVKGGLSKKLYDKFIGQKAESVSLGDDMELREYEDWWNTSDAPWNQEDGEPEEGGQEYPQPEIVIPLAHFFPEADDLAIFEYKGQKYYFSGGHMDGSLLEPYGDVHSADENGVAMLIQNFINGEYAQGRKHLKKLDDAAKQELLKHYGNVDGVADTLNGMTETTTTGSVGGAYVTPKIWAKDKKSMRFAKDPMYDGGKILEAPSPEKVERFAVEMDLYVFAPNQKDATAQIAKVVKFLDKKLPDSRARVQKLKPIPFGHVAGVNESTDRPGQIEFDDCTKLNNNKEAQNGGCSVGAVDGVVQVKESLYEKVAKKTGRSIEEVKTIIETNFSK